MLTNNPTIPQLKIMESQFLRIRTIKDLSDLLVVPTFQLVQLAMKPNYHVFTVPKKDGKRRTIEAPRTKLKQVQYKLNSYLQAVYWHRRTDAAHGFIVVPPRDPSPRHIEANARKHCGCQWLLKTDIEDFFHQIKIKNIERVFTKTPFQFNKDLAHLISKLTTFRNRLPMGAPTSPVLSNIVFAPTDLLLWQLAEKRNWTYSRYADDLSFSSESQIDWNDYAVIEKILSHAGFPLNQTKSKLFQPQDNKMITGLLVLPNKIEIPTDFIPNLVKDIQLMAGAFTVQFRMSIKSSMINERFRKMVAGKIQFAARIMGIHHPAIQKIRQKYLVAIRPPSQPLYWEEVDFEYY